MPAYLARGFLGARARASASLGAKLVLILTAVGLIGSAGIILLLAAIITPSFNSLETGAVAAHAERTRAVLDEFASKVESAARDYGNWNDSYAYMADPNVAFEKESFSPLAMTNLSVNGMAYIRADGSVQIARWLDLDSGEAAPVLRQIFARKVSALNLRTVVGTSDAARFYMRLGDRVAAVAVAPVRRSDGSGTPRGYVLMARTISSEQLSTLLQLDAALHLGAGTERVVIDTHASRVEIAVPIPGADGAPVATAEFVVPRDLSLLGKRMLLFATIGTVLLMGVVLAVLRRMIGREVIQPLHRVERHMGMVRESGDMALLRQNPRRDEICSLVTSFNSMLRQLKDLREQLEAQSFRLGQSESAVAVMHNVRNALNPISTILSQGLSETRPIDPAMADRAYSELMRDDLPPARRQKLVAFLAAATNAVEEERAERKRQLELGRQALHNVLEIIGKQQAAAHAPPQLEACDITEIVAQNATIARYSGAGSIGFSFPAQACWAMGNRVILSQVIGNLFANAAEAINATGRGSGTITASIETQGDTVQLFIRDDGEGFDPAQTPTLFQRGVSTRPHKSGGLGLHWCANAMLGMEGALDLRSDGTGRGACAVLTLKAARAVQKVTDLAA